MLAKEKSDNPDFIDAFIATFVEQMLRFWQDVSSNECLLWTNSVCVVWESFVINLFSRLGIRLRCPNPLVLLLLSGL